MVTIVAISDTHNKHKQLEIPECDILIHAGDFSGTGRFHEVRKFLDWFAKQPAKHRVLIAGNHEESMDSNHGSYNPHVFDLIQMVRDDVYYLENKAIELEGLKIYGTPWTPRFYDWGFNGLRDEDLDNGRSVGLRSVYEQIPENTEVLVCHGPPFGILDKTEEMDRPGSKELLDIIDTKLTNLRLGVYGHIHEAHGQLERNGVLHVNASSLNRAYNYANKPVVIEL